MKDMAPSATRTRKRDWRTILREELPRLLREDPEVRAQVFASLSEYFTTREETAALLAELREMRRVFSAHAEEQGRRLEEQGRILTEQGERLERLTAAVEEHTRTLAEHGERLERLTVAVEEQGRRLEEQGRILTEQGERLERLTAAVEEHTRTLAEQGERLERLTVAVEEQPYPGRGGGRAAGAAHCSSRGTHPYLGGPWRATGAIDGGRSRGGFSRNRASGWSGSLQQ
jgi:chromosome segregation ATPase